MADCRDDLAARIRSFTVQHATDRVQNIKIEGSCFVNTVLAGFAAMMRGRKRIAG
jgi:hypothetical protein